LIAGVSVTGAFDDAVAAYHGGVSFTNNLKREIIALRDPPLDLVVVINAIGGRRALDIDALRRHSEFFGEVFSIALRGDLLKAMTLNGMMIAKTLGYDIETVRRALSLGALAAGVSGNGPSLFAITREGDEGPLLDLFIAKGEGEVIVTRPAEVVRQRL
ncbi:MAG: shikimate kinase, partial [Acidilobaceae archaeon]